MRFRDYFPRLFLSLPRKRLTRTSKVTSRRVRVWSPESGGFVCRGRIETSCGTAEGSACVTRQITTWSAREPGSDPLGRSRARRMRSAASSPSAPPADPVSGVRVASVSSRDPGFCLLSHWDPFGGLVSSARPVPEPSPHLFGTVTGWMTMQISKQGE